MVRNKYYFENDIVYFDNENDMHLHRNGHTKISHYYRDEVEI